RLAGWLGAACRVLAPAAARAGYVQVNLITDNQALAPAYVTDPNLVNPWGISYGPSGPFWVSDNNAGVSTVYSGNGQPFPSGSPLVVSIPGVGAPGTPTGNVFNANFKAGDFNKDIFIFANEDGVIPGWGGGASAVQEVPGNAANTNVYKGLALGSAAFGNQLYATNFRQGTVDVYDSNFNLVKSFTDPSLPPGYAPFGIR